MSPDEYMRRAFGYTGNDPDPMGLNKDYKSALDAEKSYGADAEHSAYTAEKAWDPTAAFNAYAKGATATAENSLGLTLKRLAGQAVGAGRLNTGFYDQDQGDVVRSVYGDLNRDLASRSLQLTDMQRQHNDTLLNYGTEAHNRYLDLLSGGLDREYANYQAQMNRNAASDNSFWGGLTSLGGTLGAAAILA